MQRHMFNHFSLLACLLIKANAPTKMPGADLEVSKKLEILNNGEVRSRRSTLEEKRIEGKMKNGENESDSTITIEKTLLPLQTSGKRIILIALVTDHAMQKQQIEP